MHPLWARNNKLMQWAIENTCEDLNMRKPPEGSYYRDVWEFHRFFGHSVGHKPRFLDNKRHEFRVKLIDEEFTEFKDAVITKDLVEAADALADLVYVVIGTAVEMGIPFEAVWRAVQYSNMDKRMNPKHSMTCALMQSPADAPERCNCGAVAYTETGKTKKPEGWIEPQGAIAEILKLASS